MERKYPVIDVAETGKNIKRIMKQRGFTMKEVQEFLELGARQSIYHWFIGRNLPTVDNLYALSELFRLPVDAILVGNRDYKCRFQSDMYQRVYIYYKGINELEARAALL